MPPLASHGRDFTELSRKIALYSAIFDGEKKGETEKSFAPNVWLEPWVRLVGGCHFSAQFYGCPMNPWKCPGAWAKPFLSCRGVGVGGPGFQPTPLRGMDSPFMIPRLLTPRPHRVCQRTRTPRSQRTKMGLSMVVFTLKCMCTTMNTDGLQLQMCAGAWCRMS